MVTTDEGALFLVVIVAIAAVHSDIAYMDTGMHTRAKGNYRREKPEKEHGKCVARTKK